MPNKARDRSLIYPDFLCLSLSVIPHTSCMASQRIPAGSLPIASVTRTLVIVNTDLAD